MQRLLVSAVLLLPCVFAQAQTTIKITMPNSTTCTYQTGQVSSNATPGQLQATATGAGTGTGCAPPPSGGGVSFGPAYGLTPSTLTLAPSTSGEVGSFTFKAVNASSCSGTITGAAGGAFTSTFCSSAANCAAAQNVSTSFPNNTSTTTDNVYTVSTTCTGADASTATTSAQVTVQKSGSTSTVGCARAVPNSAGGTFVGLGGTVTMTYSGHNQQPGTDITSFDSIYQKAWPGNYGWLANFPVPKAGYISAHFKPAANYFTAANVPGNLYGEYQIGETFFSAAASMTISTQCGDFSNPQSSGSTVVPGCYINSAGADSYIAWTNSPGSCKLSGNTDYYLNVINADITNVTPTGGSATSTATAQCGSTTCTTPIANGPGSWGTYIPN